MTKTKVIHSRIDKKLYDQLVIQAKKKKMSLNNSIKNNNIFALQNDSTSKELDKKELNEIINAQKRKEQYEKITEDNHHFYTLKNALITIFDLAKFNLILTGGFSPCMPMINKVIDNYIKLVKLMPRDKQKILKPMLRDLENYRSAEYVFKRLDVIRRMEQEKVVKMVKHKINEENLVLSEEEVLDLDKTKQITYPSRWEKQKGDEKKQKFKL
jgi:hypothetical protein